ncbi:MAG: hypothetical protein H6710_11690 [Myxococcales bacterium]|nr:hypothetical protein [Myxococcales bacterium]MCB9700295.1 hypothetical protein [Myxococcales bacterium]
MGTKQPLLHEILAVEQEVKANAERARAQLIDSFRTKQSHYTGIRRTFRPFSVDESSGESGGERLEAETRLAKTVPDELTAILREVGKAIDLGLQLDEANTRARADIIVDGEVLVADVPATFLLQLERRLKELSAVFKEAPTYDPVRLWSPDASADKKHVLRAEPVTTIRKQRARKYNVMVEATKEHPAQVDIVEVDEPVGEIRSYEWTGMLSVGKKAALLEQLDRLLGAVKQARSRANTVEVDSSRKMAKTLADFLLAALA